MPPGVVTITFTAPKTELAGLTTTIWVAESLIKVVAAAVPKLTAVTSARLVPVMVTTVPPADGPLFGLTPVTVGAAADR